jgi:hypothetical protein
MKKKVLIVATEGGWHDVWFSELGARVGLDGEIALVSALSSREAEEQFGANPDLAAIVVAESADDAPIMSPFVPLVHMFRAASFTGRMIAVGERDHRRQLMRAGCGYESAMANLPQKLIEVLGL